MIIYIQITYNSWVGSMERKKGISLFDLHFRIHSPSERMLQAITIQIWRGKAKSRGPLRGAILAIWLWRPKGILGISPRSYIQLGGLNRFKEIKRALRLNVLLNKGKHRGAEKENCYFPERGFNRVLPRGINLSGRLSLGRYAPRFNIRGGLSPRNPPFHL